MVGSGADDSDIDAVSFVPSCETVNNVNATSCVQVVDGPFSVDAPNLELGLHVSSGSNGGFENQRSSYATARDMDGGVRMMSTTKKCGGRRSEPSSDSLTAAHGVHGRHAQSIHQIPLCQPVQRNDDTACENRELQNPAYT